MEKVLIIHEDEACVLWHTVREGLAAGKWNPLDDENWATLVFLKSLEEKLGNYLDDPMGNLSVDVVDLDSVRPKAEGL